MKPGRHQPNPDIAAQAERWFVRLMSDDCSAAERMAFRRWQADPEHAAAYAQTQALWRDIGSTGDRPDIQALAEQVLAETEEKPNLRDSAPPREVSYSSPGPGPLNPGPASIGDLRVSRSASSASRPKPAVSRSSRSGGLAQPRPWTRVAHAAAFAAFAVALGFLLLYQPGVHTTGLGEREIVTLADGSTVTLNTETRLEVHYGENVRRLNLVRGEALFDVAHDPQRPFLVDAGSGNVTALGTRFQVRREHERVEVTLLEGRIRVDRPAVRQKLEMEPGEQISFAANRGNITRGQVADKEAATSWTTGRLVFRATPLSEAVAEANRYARTKIRIADPLLLDLPISGTFVTGDSQNLAAALQTEMPVQATREGKEILLRFARN